MRRLVDKVCLVVLVLVFVRCAAYGVCAAYTDYSMHRDLRTRATEYYNSKCMNIDDTFGSGLRQSCARAARERDHFPILEATKSLITNFLAHINPLYRDSAHGGSDGWPQRLLILVTWVLLIFGTHLLYMRHMQSLPQQPDPTSKPPAATAKATQQAAPAKKHAD